jgi:hypothetical protein
MRLQEIRHERARREQRGIFLVEPELRAAPVGPTFSNRWNFFSNPWKNRLKSSNHWNVIGRVPHTARTQTVASRPMEHRVYNSASNNTLFPILGKNEHFFFQSLEIRIAWLLYFRGVN